MMDKEELASAAAEYLCQKMAGQGLSLEEQRAFVEKYRAMSTGERLRLWPFRLRLALVWLALRGKA